jgi:tetratricopeptide (TPR) repeat protein
MSEAPAPDFFPELRLMREEDQQELQYLRERNDRLDIEVEPVTADIFFNGKWLGQTPQTVYVNSNSSRNIVSSTAAEHLEFYENVSRDSLEKGRLLIRLEPGRPKAAQEERMPRWLRLRRRDPYSLVLMKAISQYLCEIGDFEDALEEARELVLAVPNWPVAYGHLGDVYHRMGNYAEAIEYWNTAIALKPDYGVPFLGLACAYSLTRQYSRCLEVMEKIAASDELIIYYAKLGNWRISADSDFDLVRSDSDFGARFQLIASEIDRKADGLRA